MYPRSEILFPHSCIRGLRPLVDEPWAKLIDYVLALPEDSEESLAFSLMMIHFCGCLNCDMGSYKASLGCDVCSQRATASVKGGSSVMFKRLEKARQELRERRAGGKVAEAEPEGAPVPEEV